MVIILSCLTLLLFFSCPTFSVSIYSRLSTLFATEARRTRFYALLFHIPSNWLCLLPLLLTLQPHPSFSKGVRVSLHSQFWHRRVGAAGDPAVRVLLTSASAFLRELHTYDGLRVHICVTGITQILKFRETGENSFNVRGKHRFRLNVKTEVKHSI